MHPLDDVATVIKDATDVFCVDRAGEVWVTVVPSVPAGCADPLKRDAEEQSGECKSVNQRCQPAPSQMRSRHPRYSTCDRNYFINPLLSTIYPKLSATRRNTETKLSNKIYLLYFVFILICTELLYFFSFLHLPKVQQHTVHQCHS